MVYFVNLALRTGVTLSYVSGCFPLECFSADNEAVAWFTTQADATACAADLARRLHRDVTVTPAGFA